MGLPRKLKNFNLGIDGTSYLGETTEFTQPKLTMQLEEYRSAGMNAPVEVNMGLEKLEAEFKMGGHEQSLMALFGGKINGTLLRFNGAYQRDDDETVDAVEIVCRGRITEIDEGSSKAGDDTEHTYKLSLTYYKKTVNGVDLIEIDTLNQVFIVNGKDRLAEIRDAMNL